MLSKKRHNPPCREREGERSEARREEDEPERNGREKINEESHNKTPTPMREAIGRARHLDSGRFFLLLFLGTAKLFQRLRMPNVDGKKKAPRNPRVERRNWKILSWIALFTSLSDARVLVFVFFSPASDTLFVSLLRPFSSCPFKMLRPLLLYGARSDIATNKTGRRRSRRMPAEKNKKII
jgi:hypothetical protein